eukprot:186510_1
MNDPASNLVKVPIINRNLGLRQFIMKTIIYDHKWQNLLKVLLFSSFILCIIQIIISTIWSAQYMTIHVISSIGQIKPNMELNITLESHLNLSLHNVTKTTTRMKHQNRFRNVTKIKNKYHPKISHMQMNPKIKNKYHPNIPPIQRKMSPMQRKRFKNVLPNLNANNTNQKPIQHEWKRKISKLFQNRIGTNRIRKSIDPALLIFNNTWFIQDNITMYENHSEILNPTHLNFTILKQRYNTYISSLKPLKNKNSIINDINPEQTRCKHKGKVFGIGINKSGTTSVNEALTLLGYSHNKTFTTWYGKPKAFGQKYNAPFLYFRPFYDVLNVFFMNKALMDKIYSKSYVSYNFGDSPSCFLWQVYDKLFPNSKFILMRRSSTWSIVNSNLKYATVYGRDTTRTCDMNKYKFKGLSSSDFANWIAMRYELHNQRVIDYFNKTNRIGKDLLILDMESMIKQNANGTKLVWKTIMEFLGCDDSDYFSIKTQFPHQNSGGSNCGVLVPKDYDLDWKKHFNYQIPLMYFPYINIEIIHMNESIEHLL